MKVEKKVEIIGDTPDQWLYYAIRQLAMVGKNKEVTERQVLSLVNKAKQIIYERAKADPNFGRRFERFRLKSMGDWIYPIEKGEGLYGTNQGAGSTKR